jgi:hypothetical protein
MYNFNEYWEIGRSWNLHVPFPEIVSLEPSASSMVGQQITIQGLDLLNDTQVYVSGCLISGPPMLRSALRLSDASYEVRRCFGYRRALHVTLRVRIS